MENYFIGASYTSDDDDDDDDNNNEQTIGNRNREQATILHERDNRPVTAF